MAQVNGGVFKTNDAGRTWRPIFDDQPTASIGAIAVSLSHPDVIYVGSGEGLHRPDLSVGDGVYKSLDGGKSWTHLGLRDGQQITQLAVDPRNSDRLFVAVGGHPYGPNEERGLFRSEDGGQTFAKVLYVDENTGASDVQIDPSNPSTVYAALWESREGPWENSTWNGSNGGIYKSLDGGTTWRRLSQGLPRDIVQANLALAPSAPEILCATVATRDDAKLYRSVDAGESWQVATDDPRPGAGIGGGDLPVVRFDPKDANTIYSASVVCWKSTDSGKSWQGWRGAPGGDDYQNIWINPNDSRIILLGSDQGAIVTLNGGESWSSWYNQPTAQLYHVSADNAFPYHLYSGQQESGSVGISSRGNDGAITFREWHPVGAEEYGYVTADPLDPDVIYGGKLSRYDRRTSQAVDILPLPLPSKDFRMIRTQPVIFSPLDPHLLFFSGNTLWQTRDRGDNWTQISPDLTRKTFELPASIGKYRNEPTAGVKPRGVIYAVAPSPIDSGRIWAGTDDGLIHLTSDGGKNWKDVTPPSLSAWQKVAQLDAGHFDANTAYAAINTLRLDDNRPHLLRTHDSGATWQEIVRGLGDGQTVNTVREDPRRPGLLYCGTERGVYFSLDDGENWQSLRLNLPATSVRDLIVKEDDLAIATHGRGFWILDNVTALRQMKPGETATTLIAPPVALRVRWNTNTDTPLPPDEPVGENPPDGATLDYFLSNDTAGVVTLEIKDTQGKLVRRYASDNPPVRPVVKEMRIPEFWVRPPQVLAASPGWHRFVWDLHWSPIANLKPEFPMTAIYRDTPAEATGPWAAPGDYIVTLSAGGKSFTQKLALKMDPRIKTSPTGLLQQFELSQRLYELRQKLEPIGRQFDSLLEKLAKLSAGPAREPAAAFKEKLETIAPPNRRPSAPLSFDALTKTRRLFATLQDADEPPRPSVQAAVAELEKAAPDAMAQWQAIIDHDLPELNQKLQAAGQPTLEFTPR
ncbi:MAG: glycoside hydrolase [Verrucomicrobiota bacterium]